MRPYFTLLLALVGLVAAGWADEPAAVRSIRFGTMDFYPRWSQGDQHEYTPAGQEDLARWTEMVTINYHRAVTDGEALAAKANDVLVASKEMRGILLRTDSVPRTADTAAEHLLVVLLPQPEFIEAAFTRFQLIGGVGVVTTFSHRVYGTKVGDQMSAWLRTQGPATEKVLMGLSDLPPLRPIDASGSNGAGQ